MAITTDMGDVQGGVPPCSHQVMETYGNLVDADIS
jgi:hypothetical protein